MNHFDRFANEVDFAVSCVKNACSLARSVEERMASPALHKEDRSPVTVADFSVQAFVGSEISNAFPGTPLVAEESSRPLVSPQGRAILEQVSDFLSAYKPGAKPEDILSWIDYGQGRPENRYWILDPVDGTKGFLRGGQYAVALAMAEQGRIQIAVLGCPNLDWRLSEPDAVARGNRDSGGTIAVAVRGGGAWVSSLNENRFQPMMVSDCKDTRDAVVLRSYESGHTNVEQMSSLSELLDLNREPIRLDSQAKYLLLAGGRGDLMVRLLSPEAPNYCEKIWDQAAGALLIEEAGGRITDLRGRMLDFETGRRLSNNHGILASNGHLHQAVLAALRSIGI